MSQAGTVDFIGTHPEVPILFVADVGSAVPIGNTLEILASAVAAHSVPIETVGSGNTINIEVQYASAAATSVATNAGIASFNSVDFSVDANGFVTLLGTAAVESFQVDAFTAPGTNPVTPSVSGVVTITGGQVAAGTTTNVIRTVSLAANTYTIQIQRSQAVAASTIGDNGVSHFNSTYFTVDANGFVSINGSGVGETITGNTGGALSPTAGNWNILGTSTAPGTTPVQTAGSGSTLTVQVQKSQAIASTNATNVGLAAFNSTYFTVDANGFVSINGAGIGETITGNVGGALSPTAGNWNILGTSTASGTTPVQTSGSGSTLTVQVQKAQAIASTNATNVGLAAFNSSFFTVDANGFVSINGAGIGETITGDVGGALSPTAGNWNIVGSSTAAGTTPVRTSGSVSTLTVQVQKAQAIASTDATKVGLSAFDSARFTVDANGFVSVNGAGLGETITGDTGGPLSPTAGNWNILSTSTNGIDTAGSGSTLTVGMATPYADGDFEFRSSVSGATRTLSVTNTSNTASSQSTFLHSVAGSTAGDTWSQWSVGSTTSYALGIDNSDSDLLKLTYATSGSATPSDASPFITYNAAGGQVTQLKAQAATTAYILTNTTDAASAQAQLSLKNTVSGGTNSCNLVVANTADPLARVQGRAELQTDEQCLGLNMAALNNAGTGTFKVYVGDRAAATQSSNCTAAGEWTYPVQPSFRATLSADATNVTGAGTAYTVACNTEAYDQNADYNNATYTFTAPVTGKYHFDSTIFMYGIVAATSVDITLRNSGGTIIAQLFRTGGLALAQSGNLCLSGSANIPMKAGDTAKLVLAVSGEAGDVVDIQSGTNQTCFSGWLVC